jgi:hypothetical protein
LLLAVNPSLSLLGCPTQQTSGQLDSQTQTSSTCTIETIHTEVKITLNFIYASGKNDFDLPILVVNIVFLNVQNVSNKAISLVQNCTFHDHVDCYEIKTKLDILIIFLY